MSQSTWEPLENLKTAIELVEEYDKLHPLPPPDLIGKKTNRPKKERVPAKKPVPSRTAVSKRGSVPLAPPPPPPPKVESVSSNNSSSKPVDLAAELAAKKNNLSHVEVKDYVSPSLQKQDDNGGGGSIPATGNSMMAMIMAKRNQMKKAGGGPPTGGTKPATAIGQKPSIPKPEVSKLCRYRPLPD